MKKQPVIAVIGAGALGVMFGQRMTQTLGPQRVFFAADAQRAARYAAPVSYTHLTLPTNSLV